MADRPTSPAPQLPIDRLRNLVDRACRHPTPAEANALRGALAGTVRNATTAVEGLHQQLAEQDGDVERARRWAVHLENENAQLLAELDGRDEAARERWIAKQLAETGLKSADFRNGMAMDIEPAREMVAHWVGAARAMLGDAPNYTETLVSMEVKVGESPERFAFVLQRVAPDALTPHQARQQAEARTERAEQQLANVRDTLAEVLAEFRFDTHPGQRCKQTGHVAVTTIDRWRAALDAAGQNTAETATGARESDEHPSARGQSRPEGANGPHTGAQDREADVRRAMRIHLGIADGPEADAITAAVTTIVNREQEQLRAALVQVRSEMDRMRPADEVIPHDLLRLLDMHKYVSTACDTAGACETAAGDHLDDADKLTDQAAQLHARCRRTHKFTGQPCACDCHQPDRP